MSNSPPPTSGARNRSASATDTAASGVGVDADADAPGEVDGDVTGGFVPASDPASDALSDPHAVTTSSVIVNGAIVLRSFTPRIVPVPPLPTPAARILAQR
jgi:hypothetical protein